jgi:Protein of unknown function (DUF3987)
MQDTQDQLTTIDISMLGQGLYADTVWIDPTVDAFAKDQPQSIEPERPEATDGSDDVMPDATFLDLYTQYASGCLPQVHPDYHVLSGLVMQASLLGHKLRTATRLATNLAGLIVTVSGVGKSYSTQIAIDLLQELLTREILEDTPVIATHATVEGLLEALQDKPTGIIDLDEFSGFLKDCQRDHMTSARENFCRALDGRQIKYKRARNKNVIVDEPCPSVLGTVNIEPLRRVASDEDLIGGLFSRFLIVAPDFTFLLPQPAPGDPLLHKALIHRLRRYVEMPPQRVEIPPALNNQVRDYAYSVSPYKEGQHIDLLEVADDSQAGFIRYRTHALKVAMLLAAGEPETQAVVHVDTFHVDRAISIVERFRKYAERVFAHLKDADDTRLIKRVSDLMQRFKRMTFSELHQKIGGKTSAAELRKAVDHLVQFGQIRSGEKANELVWVPTKK